MFAPSSTSRTTTASSSTVDPVTVSADDVQDELDALRSRFGTLVTVNRPAKTGDFAQLDLVATIGDEEVDTANNISYEIGSGELIEGIDEALDTLTAGESTTFESTLLGGDNAGEKALIAVTLLAVKERELPEADDDFAQIASQFDTIKELKADIKEQVEKSKAFGQVAQARDMIVDELVEEGRHPGSAAAHRRRGAPSPREREPPRGRRAPRRGRRVEREDLPQPDPASTRSPRPKRSRSARTSSPSTSSSRAAQYGMEPGEFIKVLDENGQIPAMIGEVARGKTLALILEKANIVDTKGKKVDSTPFIGNPSADDEFDTSMPPTCSRQRMPTGHEGHDHGDHEGHDHK